VVVQVDAVINPDAVQAYALALENTRAVIRAGGQENVSYQQILAAVEDHQMWTLEVTIGGILSGTRIVPFARKELRPVPVNSPRPLDRDVLGVCGGDQHDGAVAGRNAVTRFIALRDAAAQEPPLRGKV